MLSGSADVSGVDPFDAPLRVLHLHQPVSGGVAVFVREISEFQAARGWDVHVAAPPSGDRTGSGAAVTRHAWPAVRAPHRGLRREARALRRVLREVRPDVVVCHSAKAGLVGRLVLRGSVPTVLVPHAWSFLAQAGPVGWAATLWERLAARWTNVVVAVSQAEATRGVRAGVRAPVYVVRNPVPTGWDGDLPGAGATLPRDGEGRESAVGSYAVCVGRLDHQKGYDLLLDAWPTVRASVPGARLVVVGDGPLREELVSRAEPGVTFVGHVADPRPLVAGADVVVVSSRWEGCSLSMLEGMAAGRPVVTTDVDGSESVRLAGGGAVVGVGDVDALARAVAERLGGDGEPDEGPRGRAFVQEHHRRDRVLHRFSAVVSRAPALGEPASRVQTGQGPGPA